METGYFRLRLISFLVLSGVLLAPGCRIQGKGPTQLIDDFRSYQTPAEVRLKLVKSAWKENTSNDGRSGPGPHFTFITMRGPYKSLGQEGVLTLRFYNDRLMESEFMVPNYGREYIAALRRINRKVPKRARESLRVDVSTDFEYYEFPNGVNFIWTDRNLADEWNDWVAKYS
jgi:hypothetical protein